MTDEPDQAARLAAIRARRGQTPIAITSADGGERPARTPRAQAPSPASATSALSWAPPVAHEVQIPAPPAARVATPPAATVAATRPAATARTTAATAPAAKAKAKKAHPHIAAGARIVVTGLTASGIFGLTTVIAAANQPVPAANPVLDPAATTTAADPSLTTVLDPTATTVAGAVPLAPGQTVVLTIPPVGGAPATAAPVAQQQAPAANQPTQQPAAQTPTPATPAPAPAPTPPPTTAAPVTTPPPPPCTTNASGKCK